MADKNGAQELDVQDMERRMSGAVTSLKGELGGLRTGRASASLLEPVMVEAYGQTMPIAQMGTVSVPEPRSLLIQVWDKGLVGAVEKAIQNANLGVNPIIDGQNVRVPIPDLNEERRRELVRLAAKYAEQTRVAIRNVRRDSMDSLKSLEKDGHIGKDDAKKLSTEVQNATDRFVKEVDSLLHEREQEIMQV